MKTSASITSTSRKELLPNPSGSMKHERRRRRRNVASGRFSDGEKRPFRLMGIQERKIVKTEGKSTKGGGGVPGNKDGWEGRKKLRSSESAAMATKERRRIEMIDRRTFAKNSLLSGYLCKYGK